jgi:hypothetical protein
LNFSSGKSGKGRKVNDFLGELPEPEEAPDTERKGNNKKLGGGLFTKLR